MSDPLRSIHVVAGVITDARGRILLTRRTETRDMPGLWEFPGGKREIGESSTQALARELREELGIDAEVGQWMIEVPQIYPDKRLRLEVRKIDSWKGSPRGREGQALTWVAPEKLGRYSMPPADLPVVGMLRQPEHYWMTPEPSDDVHDWLACIERAMLAGIQCIQLRARSLERSVFRELAKQVLLRRGKKSVQVLLDGDVALAKELQVGVHLDASQLAGLDERPLPVDLPVAASCFTLQDLRNAQRAGCDFTVLGPVQASLEHTQSAVLGWKGFEMLREQVSLPIFAYGGVQLEQLHEARCHGAQGIAAMQLL